MSSTITNPRKKYAAPAIAGVAIAAVFALGISGVASNSAFNDTDQAKVNISTATVVLGVSDQDNSGTIDLSFPNMKPGELKTQSFTVRNDGTIPAVANLGSNFFDSVSPANSAVTYENLRIGVSQSSGSVALTTVTNLPVGGWDLGVLQPGESKTFWVDVKLGGGAGNEWQGQSFGGKLPVTLTQQ